MGETAALMGAVGADRAMMLDGGLSSQLLARSAAGSSDVFRGLRRVPLGIVGVSVMEGHPRPGHP
ncbi:MAG: phosphodiester glycosidase family protein [Gemmatimonadetes bacterium]|nr:phosphodiester glycosidase family protein [Gemmatimonadota bacterium]